MTSLVGSQTELVISDTIESAGELCWSVMDVREVLVADETRLFRSLNCLSIRFSTWSIVKKNSCLIFKM